MPMPMPGLATTGHRPGIESARAASARHRQGPIAGAHTGVHCRAAISHVPQGVDSGNSLRAGLPGRGNVRSTHAAQRVNRHGSVGDQRGKAVPPQRADLRMAAGRGYRMKSAPMRCACSMSLRS